MIEIILKEDLTNHVIDVIFIRDEKENDLPKYLNVPAVKGNKKFYLEKLFNNGNKKIAVYHEEINIDLRIAACDGVAMREDYNMKKGCFAIKGFRYYDCEKGRLFLIEDEAHFLNNWIFRWTPNDEIVSARIATDKDLRMVEALKSGNYGYR